MFLDDEIVQYVLDNKTFDEKKMNEIVVHVVNDICLKRMVKNIPGEKTNEKIKASIIRTTRSFDIAAEKLVKMNYGLLRKGGLKEFLLCNKNFAEILNKLGIYN